METIHRLPSGAWSAAGDLPWGRAGFRGDLPRLAARLLDPLCLWQERANQRHALMRLDARMLSDIGISRAEAEREFRKPFWRA